MAVDGKDFIRRAKVWGKAHHVEVSVTASRCNGQHQTIRVGPHWATAQMGEVKLGVLNAMLKQLGIPQDGF